MSALITWSCTLTPSLLSLLNLDSSDGDDDDDDDDGDGDGSLFQVSDYFIQMYAGFLGSWGFPPIIINHPCHASP